MTRISDAASINNIIRTMMRTQTRVEDANFQVVSGKVSREYAGVARESQRLVDLEMTRDLNNQFISNNKLAKLRLDVMDKSLKSAEKSIKDMRETVGNFLGRGRFDETSVDKLQQSAFAALSNMESFLNIEIDGQFLFSGSRTNQRPVDLDLKSLADFQQKYDGSITQYPTTRAAHMLQLETSQDTNNLNVKHITASNWLVFRQDDDGNPATPVTSSLEATSDMFSDYVPGSRISVTGTDSNDGEYIVQSVSDDGTKIFITTEMYTDEQLPLGLVDETTTGVAQVDTLTLGGTAEADDIFRVTVNGVTVSHTVTAGQDLDDIRDSLAAAINGHAVLGDIITASNGGAAELVLTSDAPGTFSFTTTASAEDGGGTDDSTIVVANTTATAGYVAFTLADGSTITNTSTGAHVTFDRTAGTITAANSGAFDSVSVGDVIAVSGDNGSNGSYTVTDISEDGQTLTVNAGATITTTDGTVIDADDTARMVFDRAANTITTDRSAFGDLRAGDKFTVAGTMRNNGSYTVQSVSADGKTVTIKSTGFTNEGTGSGTAFFDYNVGTRFQFDAAAGTIQAQNIDGTALTGAFSDLQVGDSIDVTGSAHAANNGTYTIGEISSDGSRITVTAPAGWVDSTDEDGMRLAVDGRGFELRTGNEIHFDAATNRVSLRDITDPLVGTADVFDNLRVGQRITVSGTASNDGTYTIASVAANGASFTVAEDIAAETFNPSTERSQVSLQVFAVAGTIQSSQSYYGGNESVITHRVDERRTVNWDINASHPAFEKAIRAMSILAQGVFGSEGGLDQNRKRIADAMYLLNDAITSPADGTPPYGDEVRGGMDNIFFELGFKQVVVHEATNDHKKFNGLLDGFISEIEDVDQLEAITRLTSEQHALKASYQALSKVLKLNLADFL